MALHGQTPGKIRAAVKALKPFHIGNVSGETWVRGHGRLPQEYSAQLRAADNAGQVKYVLYSYATPMAWLLADGTWVQPNVKYSQSTTGHQHNFAVAISQQQVSA